jgi:erythromycin esterase-like protein
MVVTPDVIGVILAAFGAAATVLAGVAGLGARLMARIDARFGRVDTRFDRVDAQFDRVDAQFDKVDAQFDKVAGEMAALRSELVEVKIAVARLEGPAPRLIRAPR